MPPSLLLAELTAARDALRLVVRLADEMFNEWDRDNDPRVGKLLRALTGAVKGYRPETDSVHEVLGRLEHVMSRRWCHRVRGTTYVEAAARGPLQASRPELLVEGIEMVAYRDLATGRTWYRAVPELEDGRFERLP